MVFKKIYIINVELKIILFHLLSALLLWVC